MPNSSLPLVFIDTNILLDFYRAPKSDLSMKMLKLIDTHHKNIISSSQVEMEFKKNRQRVVLETMRTLQKPGNAGEFAPVFLTDTSVVKGMVRSNEEIKRRHKKVREKIRLALANPIRGDRVFQTCQRLFTSPSECNLNRSNKRRFEIRNLAKKRWILGYPPRKSSETSIGDAINWEWIVDCSKRSSRDVIIVSRDSDFGCQINDESFLNDWLVQEFKARVSRKRKIILTDRLTLAFKQLDVKVSTSEEQQERKLIRDATSLVLMSERSPEERAIQQGRIVEFLNDMLKRGATATGNMGKGLLD